MSKFKAILLMLTLCLAVPAFAQPEGVDEQAAMEAWTRAATPGEFHAFLAKKAGDWKVDGKMWTAPGGEPIPSESTGTARMILGGRYLYEEMKGVSMGMPFEGVGITGYDNVTGIVTSTWYDTMGTMTTVLTGKWEKPGAPMVLTGSYVDPITGQTMNTRTVSTFVSDDESLFEYFGSMAGGEEMKMMELRYTRVK